jgi:hypothetical protein
VQHVITSRRDSQFSIEHGFFSLSEPGCAKLAPVIM